MKERSIIFSGPMVKAILEGRKTMTRRVLREQPMMYVAPDNDDTFLFVNHSGSEKVTPIGHKWIRCPYGKPGDRLWVRETWRVLEREADLADGVLFAANNAFVVIENTKEAAEQWGIAFNNNKHGEDWRPSIFMPRWASRITLEITDVRVERLQEITAKDANAEGCPSGPIMGKLSQQSVAFAVANRINWFSKGWDKINGKRKGCDWNSSPWVWVLRFKRLTEGAESAEGR